MAEQTPEVRAGFTLEDKLFWIYSQARAPLPWTPDREALLERFYDELRAALQRSGSEPPEEAPREAEGSAGETRYVTVGEDAKAAAEFVRALQASNTAYWTTERIITTLYAHRENMKAAIEGALRAEWPDAQREVFESGNSGWSQVACAAIARLRLAPSTESEPHTRASQKDSKA